MPSFVAAASLLVAAHALAAGKVEFSRDIRPILAAKCYACHGPDDDKRKADLRLDVRAEAVEEAPSSPANADASELWKRITTHDTDEVMPPPSSPKQLTENERDLLRRWIAQGAEYQEHWAFLPVRAAAAAGRERRRRRSQRHRSLHPRMNWRSTISSPRPRRTRSRLIRRVSLDLTGLPPTPEEVATFVARDAHRRTAYSHALVDRLLASPHFGERWGRHWLDMARYADSNGFLGDAVRPNAWRYPRLGDRRHQSRPAVRSVHHRADSPAICCRNPSLAQLTATGFHRNAALNTEAGVDKEEARFQNLADRVNTTGRVWMGLTVGCAQCHTHKYDPITIRDYYSFYAFFNNTEDRDEPKTKAPDARRGEQGSPPDLCPPGGRLHPARPRCRARQPVRAAADARARAGRSHPPRSRAGGSCRRRIRSPAASR